jgi:hypothetical protein
MRCLVCDANEANQSGAHIFPAWMVASAFDVEGRTRDHEIIYAVQPFDSKLPYFGNSVHPDKIGEQIGRDLTDHEIHEQKNYLTVDKLWCSKCEKRFKIVEDYFLENVDRRLNDYSKGSKSEIIELKHADNYLIRLFWYSLFVRAQISHFMGFNLYYKTYYKLKKFLNYYVKDNLQDTIQFIKSSYRKDQILKYPLRCFKGYQNESHSDGWIYVNNKYYKPYCFIINNYYVQFYGKGDRAKFKPESFFGISGIINKISNARNYKEALFKIVLLDINMTNEIKKRYINYITAVKMEYCTIMFKSFFKWKFKHNPDNTATGIFLNELINNDLPQGIKYTKENIVDALNRTLLRINLLPPPI